MKKAILLPLLFLVCACFYNPNIKNLHDQAKLEYQALVDLYLATYQATADLLTNPYVKEEVKKYVKKEISPVLNKYKKELIEIANMLEGNVDDIEVIQQIRTLRQNILVIQSKLKELANGQDKRENN